MPVLLVVACEPADVDELAGVLWAHRPAAVLEQDTPDGPALVAGFATAGDALVAADDLDHRFTFEILEAEEWLDVPDRPWRVGRIVVAPPALELAATGAGDGDLIVRIDGHAFGSGSHPSTRLALAALQALELGGCSVLDLGCGSGVLAIAAAGLGAARVIAVDVDDRAVAATTANAARNGACVDVRRGSLGALGPGEHVDLVMANLLVADQEPLAASMPGRTRVLSGILADQLDRVVAGDDVVARYQEGDWVCAVTTRPEGPAARR